MYFRKHRAASRQIYEAKVRTAHNTTDHQLILNHHDDALGYLAVGAHNGSYHGSAASMSRPCHILHLQSPKATPEPQHLIVQATMSSQSPLRRIAHSITNNTCADLAFDVLNFTLEHSLLEYGSVDALPVNPCMMENYEEERHNSSDCPSGRLGWLN